ncbi:MAG: hypothetical protein V4616_13890 [Bacteroidota bacterium]
MSQLTEVQHGAVITGYDAVNAVQICSPSYFGCKVCLAASAVNGVLTLTVSLNTPIISPSKTFAITGDINFTWAPVDRLKVSLSVTDFSDENGNFSFTVAAGVSVKLPFIGWKSFNLSHTFNIPDNTAMATENDDLKLALMMGMHSALANTGNTGQNSGQSAMLQGDIYSNYLQNQQRGAYQATEGQDPGAFGSLLCTIVCSAVACPDGSTNNLANDNHQLKSIGTMVCSVVCSAVACTQGVGGQNPVIGHTHLMGCPNTSTCTPMTRIC